MWHQISSFLLTIPHYFWLTELGNIIESYFFTLQAYFFKFLSVFQLLICATLTSKNWVRRRRLEQLFTVLPLVSFFPPIPSFLSYMHSGELPKSVFSWNDYFLLLTCLNTNYSKCVTFDFSSHNFQIQDGTLFDGRPIESLSLIDAVMPDVVQTR